MSACQIVIVAILTGIFIWRFWPHRYNFLHLFLYFFMSKRFNRIAAENAFDKELQTNESIRKSYEKSNGESAKTKMLEDLRKQLSGSTKALKNSFLQAFITVSLVLFFAWGLAFLIASCKLFSSNKYCLFCIQIISAFFILLGLVGKLEKKDRYL